MEIQVSYLQPNGLKDIHTHFLLRDAEVICIAIDHKSREHPLSVSKIKNSRSFKFNLEQSDFSRLEFRFHASVRSGSTQFSIIKIL